MPSSLVSNQNPNRTQATIPSLSKLIKTAYEFPRLDELYEKEGYWKHYALKCFPALVRIMKNLPIITHKGICEFFYNIRHCLPFNSEDLEQCYIYEVYNYHFKIRNYESYEDTTTIIEIITNEYDENGKYLFENFYDYSDPDIECFLRDCLTKLPFIVRNTKEDLTNALKFFSEKLLESGE